MLIVKRKKLDCEGISKNPDLRASGNPIQSSSSSSGFDCDGVELAPAAAEVPTPYK